MTTSTLVFLRLAMISSAIFLFIINIALGISLKVPHGRSWAALFGLGLVSQLGGYLALTYALGQGVEYYDEPAVRKIMREAAPGDYRWSSLILGIVKSGPFQMRRTREP